MNSDQERVLFEDWGWAYDYVARKWVAPNGCEISTDQIVEITCETEGDIALMALIVENGIRATEETS